MLKKLLMAGLILTVSQTFVGCAPGENMKMDMTHGAMDHQSEQR